ncbi:unnamed protein product [Plutella xylostella]|uniref:(diamondback moth) hypothetical protein n=1 Tax=Plutella xylostella TaxID=51655 RepID=A0A8S4EFV5_PLUXY|nr:unnamed protein product [Plutella xylostella]
MSLCVTIFHIPRYLVVAAAARAGGSLGAVIQRRRPRPARPAAAAAAVTVPAYNSKSETDAERLTISSATRTADGKYTCEVSADAPSFQTSQVHAVMRVVDRDSRCFQTSQVHAVMRVVGECPALSLRARQRQQILPDIAGMKVVGECPTLSVRARQRQQILPDVASMRVVGGCPALSIRARQRQQILPDIAGMKVVGECPTLSVRARQRQQILPDVASMRVVDLPPAGPELHGVRPRYRAGARLRAECVLRASLPAANLSFYINSEPAQAQHVWQRVEVGADKLLTAYSTIAFVVQKHHFQDHRLKLRCTAIIYSIYIQSTEKSAAEEREKTRPTSETKLHEAIVFPIHRLPETGESHSIHRLPETGESHSIHRLPETGSSGAGGARGGAPWTKLFLLMLPLFLRKIWR